MPVVYEEFYGMFKDLLKDLKSGDDSALEFRIKEILKNSGMADFVLPDIKIYRKNRYLYIYKLYSLNIHRFKSK